MYGPTDEQAAFFAALFIGGIVFIPLGIWKAVEILIWFFTHISWSWP